jgi:type I restriction enzyme R subunit
MIDKKSLSERDICTKYITPALQLAGWNIEAQILEEVSFTDGKIYVRGKLTARGKKKRADYILYYKPNIPIAIIEAKDNKHEVGSGIQQALEYARILDIPSVFSSNGDGFLFHNRTIKSGEIEKDLPIDAFPSPQDLWQVYKNYKGITTEEQEKIIRFDYYQDNTGRRPRYYQQIAINRTVEAIAKGQNRVLLIMATGTGKTYTAFQIIYRLWKSEKMQRILFLADRTSLIDQTRRGDFKFFRDKMTIIKKKVVENNGKEELVSNKKRGIDITDKAYEIFLGLYQGLTDTEGIEDAYKDFSPDFFDLIVVDECHRGSAAADSSWRRILEYFSTATHIGLTATPKETFDVSNIEYFGKPIYTYSLKQGINDGFLAPYKVVRIDLNIDQDGWRPPKGYLDKNGNPVDDRVYNRIDFDKTIVVEERRKLVAKKITEFLKATGRMNKTILFCIDIEHADGMRKALVNANSDLIAQNSKYVMKITGDDEEGKREIDSFINPESKYPVIVTTSKLLTTGVDAQTCKVIVLDTNIQSMTEFKQIIGRGTRINEEFGKMFFTILDFRNVTRLFLDPLFDGDPIRVKPASDETDFTNFEEEEEQNNEEILDEDSGEKIDFKREQFDTSKLRETKSEKREKIFVRGVDVSVLIERELYFDKDGRPITTSLKDHTKKNVREVYKTADEFIDAWKNASKKQELINDLSDRGILVEDLQKAVGKDLDFFDTICHVAYDMPPLTRKERANNVKKRNYFTRYGDVVRKVLEALLEKYAEEGVENVESMDVLKIKPMDEIGTPTEIIKAFGGREKYLQAISDLENVIYIAI